MKRRILQYLAGLFVMALGIVLIKKASLGMSPISSIPSAISNITPFTLGNTTIFFQLICFVLILAVNKKADIKTVLIVPLSVLFGFLIDLYMFLLPFRDLPVWLRFAVCFAGILATAFGIVIIVGTDLMLPAPDALLRAVSTRSKISLVRVKFMGDAIWVALALVVELSVCRRILSVGAGTVLSVLLTGKFVGLFGTWFPKLKITENKSDDISSL